MKVSCFLLGVILNISSCNYESLNGTWISNEDKKSKIAFKNNRYYSIYDTDTVDQGTFERSIYTCDSSYIDPTTKADFILLKGDIETCYEITGISDSILAYRYTATGRLHVFTKEKK